MRMHAINQINNGSNSHSMADNKGVTSTLIFHFFCNYFKAFLDSATEFFPTFSPTSCIDLYQALSQFSIRQLVNVVHIKDTRNNAHEKIAIIGSIKTTETPFSDTLVHAIRDFPLQAKFFKYNSHGLNGTTRITRISALKL
ncbi:Uncharacterised protein [Streptococcus pneumoniae]|nr:Uncharacterised protein [Streptococcus pneumoniae]